MLYGIIVSTVIVTIISNITIFSNTLIIISHEWATCRDKSRYLGVFGLQRWTTDKSMPKCQVHLDGQGQKSRKVRAQRGPEK